jgi:hypothetical protein
MKNLSIMTFMKIIINIGKYLKKSERLKAKSFILPTKHSKDKIL